MQLCLVLALSAILLSSGCDRAGNMVLPPHEKLTAPISQRTMSGAMLPCMTAMSHPAIKAVADGGEPMRQTSAVAKDAAQTCRAIANEIAEAGGPAGCVRQLQIMSDFADEAAADPAAFARKMQDTDGSQASSRSLMEWQFNCIDATRRLPMG